MSFCLNRTRKNARKMFHASLLYLPVFMSGLLFYHQYNDDNQNKTDGGGEARSVTEEWMTATEGRIFVSFAENSRRRRQVMATAIFPLSLLSPEIQKKGIREKMAARQRAVATLPTLMRALRKEVYPRPSNQPLPSLRRAFSLYDQINLINNVPDDQLRFEQFTDTGFKVSGVMYEGSVLCIGNVLLSWSPKKLSEITPDSLSMFQIVRPIPEILVLGCGRYTQQVDPELRRFIRSTGMKLEAIDSRNAASTYNILNEEGRVVAAALLPYGAS